MEIMQKLGSANTHDSFTMYQRGKMQEDSIYYEHKKHDCSLPLIDVNTYLPKEHAGEVATKVELIRSTEEEKGQQIVNVQAYQRARNQFAPSGEASHAHATDSADDVNARNVANAANVSVHPQRSSPQASGVEGQIGDKARRHGLGYLQNTARDRKDVFVALVEMVKTHSLGQISLALYDVGVEYRRNM